jgi:23S rRNA pseudouridine1911/1915/1917 synthase
MNQGWIYREQVNHQDDGLTVLDYYSQRYLHSTVNEWQERITAGQILLNGHPAQAETLVHRGQWLTYHRPPWQEPDVPLTIEVLYEDSELLVVAKPSGLPVLPGGGFLEHTLLWQLQQRYADHAPVPIHRLGRGTSGLMLWARSPHAKSALSQQMRDRQIQKIYQTWVNGNTMPDSFTVTQPIGKIPYPVLGYVYAATESGLTAHSDCRVLQRDTAKTLMEVTIVTGRPHQIRIHMATAGYPLVGDPLYGVGGIPLDHLTDATTKFPVPGDCGYYLHAVQLAFQHPASQKAMTFIYPSNLQFF